MHGESIHDQVLHLLGGVEPPLADPPEDWEQTPLYPPVTSVTASRVEVNERDGVTDVTAPYREGSSPLDGIFNGVELFAGTYPPPTFVVPRLIPEGLTLLVGSPKIGKSWLTYGIALASASGGLILGETVARRPVLHLAMEDSKRRLFNRAQTLGHTSGQPLWNAMLRLPQGVPASRVIEAWLGTEAVASHPLPPLVIVDTLGRVKGARRSTESPYDHDYRVGAAMKAVADSREGMALVAVHHDRKADTPDFVDAVSGTNGLAGAADTIVLVRRDRNTPDGLLSVTGRDEVEGAYAARFVDGVWSLDGDSWDAAARAAQLRAAMIGKGDATHRVVQWIAANGGGAKPAEVAEALDITGQNARQILSRLHREGRLDKSGEGHYTIPAAKGRQS